MAEAKKEEKSIEDTFGELDLLARKLEDKETPLERSLSASTDREWSS